ncbi:hypothetical protein N7492_005558 [Penicillium capsulatum]|uniref:TPR domain protein n=1 Tax=Penicillium capsulatum TaxID=69766 RepID=A0A9W9I9T2_9EURO|nr:hypothetical protein N7492_005558 [Penicillium capsulatum]KAJ6135342.1 hypothetical protein N7512_000502 [Penicillium capsulatum]
MFRAVSRRVSALSPGLQAQRQFLARSIHIRTRPTPFASQTKPNPLTLAPLRHLSFAQRLRLTYRDASKGIFRKNPILLPLAILSAVGGIAIFAYISYVELTRVGPQYQRFPQPVADVLRTAVYYTEIDLNPAKALSAYKEALRIALDVGMHPFSDEIIGIKLQVALMLEKSGLMKPAIEVLERTKKEILSWIEEDWTWEGPTAAESKSQEKQKPAKAEPTAPPGNDQVDQASPQDTEKDLMAKEEFEARQRARALKKVVGMQMKLAELYSSDYIQDERKAEAARITAVELCLKEMHRRQKAGLPIGIASIEDDPDDSWLNMTEMATALAELANTYSAQERHELALPLYLRALDMIQTTEGDSPTCKQVVLLNDVATAIAGQAQVAPLTPKKDRLSRENLVEGAQKWTQSSLDMAARIQPPVRDEECDITCAVATYNLGELAELQNKAAVAKQRYTEAKALSKGIGYDEGVSLADEALKRLGKK